MLLAHGLGGRSDLPVPLWMALYGAAAAVVVSFFALVAFWRSPRLTGAHAGRTLPARLQRIVDARFTRSALRIIGVFAFGVTVVAARVGSNNAFENPAPTWLYVWLWVGLVPASLLLGPVWRALNPLRAFSAGISRLAGDPEQQFTRDYPERLGYWPAAASLVAFLWLELVYERAAEPQTVFGFVVLYSFVHLIFANRYGERWFARADGFEVYSTLIARLSPLGRRDDGRLVVRNPFDGLAGLQAEPGLVAVVSVLLGSTAFDGVTRTGWWADITEGTAGFENAVFGSAGLAAAIGLVAVTYLGATRVSVALARRTPDLGDLAAGFVHSLVPIAIGYTIAHYFSLLVFQGQAGYLLASDPFDSGWNLFGTAGRPIDYLVVSTHAIALVQVAAIVIGHIAGVVAAHDRAVGVFTGADKTRSQYSLLAVMVGYTIAGIALLVGT
ncbi:MAG TPA: hypothetical protein VM784_00840 [Actinomycetota bacterium]|nr:hypothetical protein [Actinomycetota bacterium]